MSAIAISVLGVLPVMRKEAIVVLRSSHRYAAMGLMALFLIAILNPDFCRGQPCTGYLLAGSAECMEAMNSRNIKRGSTLSFLVAVTPDRVLSGWQIELPHGESGEAFFYASAASPRPVSFEFFSTPAKSMLAATDRDLKVVVEQGTLEENSHIARVSAAQTAVFGNISFAAFFASAFHGIRCEDIDVLRGNGKPRASSDHPCGQLTVVNEGGLRIIELSQSADQLFTIREPGTTLRSVRFAPFNAGLQRAQYTCTFDPPWHPASKAPWRAECVTEEVGTNAQVLRVRYSVTIHDFTTEMERVNAEVDKIVSLVPNGEHVVTSGPVEHEWEDGRIVRRIDADALRLAEQLEMSQRSTRVKRVVLVIVAMVVLGILLVVRQRLK